MSNKFELFLGCLGNGTTVCNKAVIENGDYKTIAHISEHGVIKFYVPENYIPDEAMQKIKSIAAKDKEKFLETWDKKSTLEKYRHMMEIPTIGCGLNAFQMINMENKNLSLEEKVKLMEEKFFKTHM